MRFIGSSSRTLRHGQHQRLAGRALDPDLVALLDDREAFARLEAEFLLAFAHHVFDRDERRRHERASRNRRATPATIALRRMLAPVAKRAIAR